MCAEEHLKWIERLPLMHVNKHRIFVHAGVNPNCSLDEQDPQDLIWKIYDDRDESGHGQRHIVHGHHQHARGPILKKNRTNLDTFAWYTGRLVIAVFDDDTPGGPLDITGCAGQTDTGDPTGLTALLGNKSRARVLAALASFWGNY
jgi:serine/threonine protein phosphatase 1